MSVLVSVTVLLVAGAAYAKTIVCTGGGSCIGTPKHDLMRGGAGEDRMVGKAGDDGMMGSTGQDMLKGKDGSDIINGGDDDKAKGNAGRDNISGDPGDDIIRGGSHGGTNDGARDVLDCGDGNDTVYFVQSQYSISNCEVLNPPEP